MLVSFLLCTMACSLAVVIFGWLIYPVALGFFRDTSRRWDSAGKEVLAVSVVVATREPAQVMRERVANLLLSDFPKTQLQIVVALDATISHRHEEYSSILPASVDIIRGDPPGGKAGALNAAVRAAKNEILVFADSRQTFAANAIGELVRELDAGPYSAMSGRLISAGSASPRGVIDIFWWYEQWIRRREARVHSVIGVTGAIYAMRRKLWQALPAGTLCDDMLVPMKLVLDGHRVGFCDNAMAFDNRKFSPKEEFRRKVRTQTGNLQLCLFESRLLDPRVNPAWLQFVCHKLIRIATPILLMLALPGIAICIWRLIDRWTGLPLLIVAAALTAAFTVLALATRGRVLRQTQVFFMLLAAPLVAIYFAARGKWNVW